MSYLARVPCARTVRRRSSRERNPALPPSLRPISMRWRSQTNGFQEVSNSHFQGDDGVGNGGPCAPAHHGDRPTHCPTWTPTWDSAWHLPRLSDVKPQPVNTFGKITK